MSNQGIGEIERKNLIIFLDAHAEKVFALMQVGFFDMKNGSIECHFDVQGKLRKIEKRNVFNVVDVG